MKKSKQTGLLAAWAVILAACGPALERAQISVVDHADALTTSAGDNLFTLTLTSASAPYAVADISVVAGLAGQTASVMNFTHNDTNGDGKIDPGESLSVTEPIVNLFDATAVGKSVAISLDQKREGNVLFQIATATWTPAN